MDEPEVLNRTYFDEHTREDLIDAVMSLSAIEDCRTPIHAAGVEWTLHFLADTWHGHRQRTS